MFFADKKYALVKSKLKKEIIEAKRFLATEDSKKIMFNKKSTKILCISIAYSFINS